jgi:hypothetical protein
MVDVPAIAYIGSSMIQGGTNPQSEFTSSGTYETQAIRDKDAHRVCPDSDANGAPTASSLNWYPWFDGNAGTVYTVSGATSTTVTVTPDPGWTTDEWVGYKVTNNNLTGLGFRNRAISVTANSSDTITVASWTATPETGAGVWFNEGLWKDVAMNAAWRTLTEVSASVTPTRSGAAYAQGNNGAAPDQMLVRQLWKNIYTASPYFQFWKYAHAATTTGGWNDGGTARAGYVTEKARVDAAWTTLATGNTLRWDYAIIDQSNLDVYSWRTSGGTPANVLLYEDDMTEMIAWLRSASVFNNSSLKVILVSHDTDLRNVEAPSGTAAANNAHQGIALADSNVRVCNLNGLELALRGIDSATPTWQGEDSYYYSTSVYQREYPTEIRRTIDLWQQGAAPNVQNAIPVYIFIGDSLAVGTHCDLTFTTALESPTLTNTARNSLQKIYNRSTGNVEAYDAHNNSNTSGSTAAAGSQTAGPEFSLTQQLYSRHPDTGFVIIKRGSNASTLIANGSAYSSGTGGRWSKTYAGTEHYDEMRADIENALQYINVTLERQAEVMGFFVSLGTNDQAVSGGGDLFTSHLPVFVRNLRTDFGTHTSGKDTPIVWRKPQLNAGTAINAEAIKVRAALVARAAADKQFRLMNVDDIEISTDNVHETAQGTIDIGERFDAELNYVALPNC